MLGALAQWIVFRWNQPEEDEPEAPADDKGAPRKRTAHGH
jgi:hypothetical protein